ncbi:MAG: HAD-IC family P-type ATPase, partial [Deltaproteobacteria bacterium]|nr:HAD-IC family P-type ATPase [Deltaproteobacteria bacterium]
GAEALERISGVESVVLDKTGTLTQGTFEVLDWVELGSTPGLKEAVYAIEEKSAHPIGKALVEYLKPKLRQAVPAIESFDERPGQGVGALVGGQLYSIRPLREAESSACAVYRENTLVAEAYFGDRIRPDSARCVSKLREMGLVPYIVSGDNYRPVHAAAAALHIDSARVVSGATPEDKRRFAESEPRALMVGDGANDALALASAYVGIAVHGSVEVSLRAADVYVTRPGLAPVVDLVRIAKETMATIHRNFAFSLLYNVAGGLAAATGHVSPLFAALLMPLSAFTVFASSLWGTRKLRRTLKAPAPAPAPRLQEAA